MPFLLAFWLAHSLAPRPFTTFFFRIIHLLKANFMVLECVAILVRIKFQRDSVRGEL